MRLCQPASSCGLALGIGRQPVGRDELGRQLGGHPLLAPGDLELLPVGLHRPLERQPELPERLVEGDAVAVTLRIGQDAVAVEHEGRHQRLALAAEEADVLAGHLDDRGALRLEL